MSKCDQEHKEIHKDNNWKIKNGKSASQKYKSVRFKKSMDGVKNQI